MGYTLQLSAVRPRYLPILVPKLYGYVSDNTLHQMKSHQFLEKYGYIDRDELWKDCIDHEFLLPPNKAREFLTLYKDDINTYNTVSSALESLKSLYEYIEHQTDGWRWHTIPLDCLYMAW